MNKKALLLHAKDNCAVALMDILQGDTVAYDAGEIVATADIALGHKISIADIPKDGKIFKYGAIIGSATEAIRRGDHIHTQNLASDYITGFHH
jgi:altronate dehydratase small subunit